MSFQKDNTGKAIKILVECKSSDGFWDVSLGDVANILIALISVGLGYYVFVYQRKKDKRDRQNLISQIKTSTKLEMFKLLIIEPNVDNIHVFFQTINTTFQGISNVIVTSELKTKIIAELDNSFNDFESNLILLFYGIDQNFYSEMIEIIDTMRDETSKEINNLPLTTLGDISAIELLFIDFKAKFISGIYNFHYIEI
jgi:hypothetical protein